MPEAATPRFRFLLIYMLWPRGRGERAALGPADLTGGSRSYRKGTASVRWPLTNPPALSPQTRSPSTQCAPARTTCCGHEAPPAPGGSINAPETAPRGHPRCSEPGRGSPTACLPAPVLGSWPAGASVSGVANQTPPGLSLLVNKDGDRFLVSLQRAVAPSVPPDTGLSGHGPPEMATPSPVQVLVVQRDLGFG